MQPLYGSTTKRDIFGALTKHFNEKGINIRKIFVVKTNGAYVGQHCGFVIHLEEEIRHPAMKLLCILFESRVKSDGCFWGVECFEVKLNVYTRTLAIQTITFYY